MKYIAYPIYIVLQILFLPFSIIGVIWMVYKQLFVSKKLGASGTAVEVINSRWTMDKFGIREDEASVKLMEQLPNSSSKALWLCLFPLYALYKISGQNLIYPTVAKPGEDGVAHLFVSRSLYIDKIIEKHNTDAAQFVVLGAGFDTRCYSDLTRAIPKVFELDQKDTQQLKTKYLYNAGINQNHVHFIEIDFANEDWFEQLLQSDYLPQEKTIFLWEGVTLYLSENDIRNTLQKIKVNSTSDSILIVDIYSKSFVTGEYVKGMKKSLEALKITDEELTFGLDFSDDFEAVLNSFVDSEGLVLNDHYFIGQHTKKGTYMVVAEIGLGQ